MVFNFIIFLLSEVKLLTIGHGTNFKSTVPFQPVPMNKPMDTC